MLFKHQWHALFDNRSYLATYLLLFFLPLYLPLPPRGPHYWQPQHDSSTVYFIVLISPLAMNYPCMLWKMSQECAVWNNNAVHSVQCAFLLSPGSCFVCCIFCRLHWKTLRHEFVLFLCLGGMLFCCFVFFVLFFFVIFVVFLWECCFFPLCVERNNRRYVSNKR